MAEFIDREVAKDVAAVALYHATHEDNYTPKRLFDALDDIPAADVQPVPEGGIGELSDGYHTFNGLYYQRMVLFAALVKQNKDKSWKSLRHEDGELCFGGGWFIVGIDTPSGSYTYHYEDNFWSMFDCEELPVAKHWDGHTEKDVTRLLSLPTVKPLKWISATERLPDFEGSLLCMRKTAFGLSGQEVLYYEDGWFSYDGIERLAGGTVTHWMPLPEPPKDGEDDE